jgi:hypothetical protein
MRQAKCVDCPNVMDCSDYGKLPSRCDTCARARRAGRAQELRAEKGAGLPRVKICKNTQCGSQFEVESRFGKGMGGRSPDYCQPCRDTHESRRVRDWTENTLNRHGSSREDYARRLDAQGGGCAICRSVDPRAQGGRFVVDHDHDCCSGKTSCGGCIRGLLCGPCNILLGMARNDVAIIDRARLYLDHYAFVKAVA